MALSGSLPQINLGIQGRALDWFEALGYRVVEDKATDYLASVVRTVPPGIDFMKESKLTLDFDQKSLIIPDDQIKQLPKVEKPVEIDLSDTKLSEGQKQKLRNLFNSFKGLFSDQPGLTHVLYHEIDTGDKGPVVSRPYRFDRVKQGIIDYHIEKML
ncbi:hypothetical protein TNCV_1149611 [Trichonephila clavipes]|nr:hypothetical protein TNCV_1149611 [Trichonephila clavipes]